MCRPLFLTCLLLFFFASFCAAQTKKKYDYYIHESNGGLCSSSILVFRDSTYCSESGCEASSRFSFGRWKLDKDLITFTPTNPASFKLIDTIVKEKTANKNITVMVFDRDGNNITERITVAQLLKGRGIYPINLDSTKKSRTDIRRMDSHLILPGLKLTFRQNTEIELGEYNQIKIYLNIPSEWNFHSNSKPGSDDPFKLKKKKDKLISLNQNRIDDKGNLVITEFLLKK